MKNSPISNKTEISASSKPKANSKVEVILCNVSNLASTKGSRVSCWFCRESFEALDAFKSHGCCALCVYSINETERVFECLLCKKCFSSVSLLQKHLNIHRTFKCTVCPEGFMTKVTLIKHLVICHRSIKIAIEGVSLQLPVFNSQSKCENNENKSDFCDKSTKRKCKTKERFEKQCSYCNKAFKYRHQYDQHVLGHETNKCLICKLSFPTKKLLRRHRRAVHALKEDVKSCECPVCNKVFQRPIHLKYHQFIHTGEKPVHCHTCQKGFRNKSNLMRHVKSASHCKSDTVPNDKSFACEECDSCFNNQHSLTRHLLTHNSSKLFQCDSCDYSTKYEANLKRHIFMSHKGTKNYKCELCGASFKAQKSLLDHKSYVHSTERDFVCETCLKAFKGKSDLQRHLKVHSNDRPFKCHCQKEYKRMSHLKRHLASAHQIDMETDIPGSTNADVDSKVLAVASSNIHDSHALQHLDFSSHLNKAEMSFVLHDNFALSPESGNLDDLLHGEQCPSYFSAISQSVLDTLKESVVEAMQSETTDTLSECNNLVNTTPQEDHLSLLFSPRPTDKKEEILNTPERIWNSNEFFSPSKMSLPSSPLFFQASDFEFAPEECEPLLNTSFVSPPKAFPLNNKNSFDLPTSQFELLSSSLECNPLLPNADWLSSLPMNKTDAFLPNEASDLLHSYSAQNTLDTISSSFLFSGDTDLVNPVPVMPLIDINFYNTMLYVD